MQNLKNYKIHFVGINGTSMSGLMMLAHSLGAIVSGSDKVAGEYYNHLKMQGMNVYVGINQQVALQSDMVVYSGAIPQNHPELTHKNKMERGEFLGYLSKFFENTIAVAGTHGKTTVTAIICHVLKMLKKDFSFTFGGIDCNSNSNWGYYSRKLLVLEACEYRNSFLSLNPTISVITSVEYDHPDFFTSFDSLTDSFSKFASNTKNTLILGKDVENKLKCSNAHMHIVALDKNLQILQHNNSGECILSENGKKVHIESNLTGEYNIQNICIAYSVLRCLGITSIEIAEAIKSFKGVRRRQEFLGYFNGAKCYTDYAHHPTQIRALITGMKQDKRITVIFEPHTYSRTRNLIEDFASCFDGCDNLIILPVYEAREIYDKGGDSFTLYNNVRSSKKYLAKSYDDALNYVKNNSSENDIILFVGAGTIDDWARSIVKEIKLF